MRRLLLPRQRAQTAAANLRLPVAVFFFLGFRFRISKPALPRF
jgi:hypothetical protein